VSHHYVIDRELYLTAKKMIDLYGEDAVDLAAAKAELLLAGGHMDASDSWERIIVVIEELTSTNRGSAPLN
jgi:hypothetical protein